MIDVFTTWFGDPAREPMEIDTQQDDPPLFPDVEGIRRIATAARAANTRFHFCCMAKSANKYKAAFQNNIDIVVIEDQFETTKDLKYLPRQVKPSPNLSADVDYIIRNTIGYRGNKKWQNGHLAFLKDLWSLFCVWKFGGYHLDSGCFPNSPQVVFPECSTLGVMGSVEDWHGGKKISYYDVQAPFGKFPVTIMDSSASYLKNNLGLTFLKRGLSPLTTAIDCWAVRGSAGEKLTEVALQTYVNLWFATQAKGFASESIYRGAQRHTIITACATGITHQIGKGRANMSEECLMRGLLHGKTLEAPSIKKFGFKSHR